MIIFHNLPLVTSKPASTVIHPGDKIVSPSGCAQVIFDSNGVLTTSSTVRIQK